MAKTVGGWRRSGSWDRPSYAEALILPSVQLVLSGWRAIQSTTGEGDPDGNNRVEFRARPSYAEASEGTILRLDDGSALGAARLIGMACHPKPTGRRMVEQIGIKPTTSSLRTTRSIN